MQRSTDVRIHTREPFPLRIQYRATRHDDMRRGPALRSALVRVYLKLVWRSVRVRAYVCVCVC